VAKVGAPVSVWTPERIAEVIEKAKKYTEATEIPILAEFCYQNGIRRQTMYENPAFADVVKTLLEKKESQLERLGLGKEINTTMAIFSLKQLGWRDNHEEMKIPPGKRLIIEVKNDEPSATS